MKLSITQDNIDQGTPAHGYLDPIGLAVRDAYPKAQYGVSYLTVSVQYRPTTPMMFFILPQEVQDWIEKYENGQEVQPIEFEMVRDTSFD